MSQEKRMNLSTYLAPEAVEDFFLIKRYYRFGTNAEVVRFLIGREARDIRRLSAQRVPDADLVDARV